MDDLSGPDSPSDLESESTSRTVDSDSDPGPGFLEIRSALVGLGLIWLTAFATFGAIAVAVYGLTVSFVYLPVSVVAAAVAVLAAFASLRRFGYR